jgi:NAD(P)H dehydrogenase (quinone)
MPALRNEERTLSDLRFFSKESPMPNSQKPALLVTGAGGHLGRRVVELLLEAGAGRVIAATRDPDRLGDLARRGVDVRKADFDDPASLASAFAGADRLLLISTNALGAPGLRLGQHRNAVAAAEKAGVGHVVYTSAPCPYPTPQSSLIDDHFWTEEALFASGLNWTILRDNIYAEIALLGLQHAVASGQLFTAAGTGGRNYVTREDCARTAAAALAAAEGRQILDVNGPGPVTQDELAAMASELAGRTITHVSLSPEALREGLLKAGLPPIMADGLVAFDVDASMGRHAITAPTVKALTGREPTPLRDFLAANKAALLPRVAQPA